jgi:hypothetical protein
MWFSDLQTTVNELIMNLIIIIFNTKTRQYVFQVDFSISIMLMETDALA